LHHAPFLKLISQERKNGRMVDVDSVWVCRCGGKFPSDRQLIAHVYEPFGPGHENPETTNPRLPALTA